MVEYIKFWMAKLLFDIGVFVAFILAIVAIGLVIAVYITIKQKLCDHTDAYENQFPRKFRGDYHCPDCDLDFDKPKGGE